MDGDRRSPLRWRSEIAATVAIGDRRYVNKESNMLVLTRKAGEIICIGDNIEVFITDITKSAVRIGIKAPKNTLVYRKEVYERILQENQAAASVIIENSKLADIGKLITRVIN